MDAGNTNSSPLEQIRALEERVRLSGASLPKMEDPREQWQGVKCRAAGLDLILPLEDVAEILKDRFVTPIPRCAAWVRGVVNRRGRLLPVFNLDEYFGQGGKTGVTAKGGIIVVESGRVFCGLEVDEVFGMQKFYQEDFREAGADLKERAGAVYPFIAAAIKIEDRQWQRLKLISLSERLMTENPARA